MTLLIFQIMLLSSITANLLGSSSSIVSPVHNSTPNLQLWFSPQNSWRGNWRLVFCSGCHVLAHVCLLSWCYALWRNATAFILEVQTGLPCSSKSKDSSCDAGDQGSIPGLGRSPGEGNGNPLHCSCLENSMGREAWWATVHGVTKSQTRLSD